MSPPLGQPAGIPEEPDPVVDDEPVVAVDDDDDEDADFVEVDELVELDVAFVVVEDELDTVVAMLDSATQRTSPTAKLVQAEFTDGFHR